MLRIISHVEPFDLQYFPKFSHHNMCFLTGKKFQTDYAQNSLIQFPSSFEVGGLTSGHFFSIQIPRKNKILKRTRKTFLFYGCFCHFSGFVFPIPWWSSLAREPVTKSSSESHAIQMTPKMAMMFLCISFLQKRLFLLPFWDSAATNPHGFFPSTKTVIFLRQLSFFF